MNTTSEPITEREICEGCGATRHPQYPADLNAWICETCLAAELDGEDADLYEEN